MNIKGCLSHKSDDWKTPTWLYTKFMEENYIDCFPYQSLTDQTKVDYKKEKLFINPPFSKMAKITPWICRQIENDNLIALLIPARTDTNYFHKLLEYRPEIYFIKGRLKYNDSKSAPFPTILLIFNSKWTLTGWQRITQKELEKTNEI